MDEPLSEPESLYDAPDEPSRLGQLTDWQRVASNGELCAAARSLAADDEPPVAGVTKLRRRWSEVEVRIALHLEVARRRAAAKFSDPARLLCDREGVEQASSERVAGWKAKRFAAALASGGRVVDLCSGIGGDAMALAPLAPTLVVDHSPTRAWMAETNARCSSLIASVEVEQGRGAFVHIDPARRIEGAGARRLTPIHTPSLDHCVAIARAARGAAIKVGPGTAPELLPGDATLEWISDRGTLVQLVAWMGALSAAIGVAPGERVATSLRSGSELAIVRIGRDESVPLAIEPAMGRFLYVPDPALERSRLLGGLARELDLAEPAAGLGIVTGATLVPSPWFGAYEVLDDVRADERTIAASLRAHGATDVRVRTRGGAADVDQLSRELRKRLRGDSPTESATESATAATGGSATCLDAFILRTGSTRRAFVCRPT